MCQLLIISFMLMKLSYCCVNSLQAIEYLQNAFIKVQSTLMQLKVVLNADKTKLMLFTKYI